MDHKDLCEHTRIRLIAAAVGFQQCTKTASNIVHIPGGERVIAIGTPAQVRALLPGRSSRTDISQRLREHATNLNLSQDLRDDLDAATEEIERYYSGMMAWKRTAEVKDAAAICDGVAAKSKNSLFRSGAKICAGEIRASLAGDQVDSEGGHHD